MKRLLRVFAFLGGLGAIGWLIRNRVVGVTMNREPETPELAPEPIPAASPESDLTRIDGVSSAYAERLHEAGITTAAQLAEADAEALAARTGIADTHLASWIENAAALN